MEGRIQFIHNDVIWTVDPQNKFSERDPWELVNLLGLIPDFISNDEMSVEDTALARYGFNIGGPLKGGEVTKDMEFKYPGDPSMWPFAVAELPSHKLRVLVYNHGFTAFQNTETWKANMYRFD